jgi:hypothetical protein
MRVTGDEAATTGPLIVESDVPAHPYEVLGVAGRREWRVALLAEHMSLVPERPPSR